MQIILGSAVVTLTVAGSFVVAFVVQKTALGLLLKAMAGRRRSQGAAIGALAGGGGGYLYGRHKKKGKQRQER